MYASSLGVTLRYYRNDSQTRKKRQQRRTPAYKQSHGRAPDSISDGITPSSSDNPILSMSLLEILNDSFEYTGTDGFIRVPADEAHESNSDQNTPTNEVIGIEPDVDPSEIDVEEQEVQMKVVSRKGRRRRRRNCSAEAVGNEDYDQITEPTENVSKSISRQLREISSGEIVLGKRKRTSFQLSSEYD